MAPVIRVRDVLAALIGDCRGLLELRALPSTDRAFVAPSDIAAIEGFAIAHRHEHVYFAVATRRDASSGALENCEQLGAVYVDLDCHGDAPALADATARLAAFPLQPSIVIRSGGGLHVYWLLREPADVPTEAAALRSVLRQLAHALDGDVAAAECARVLRLPGTLNHKYDPPVKVTIHTFDPSRRVNLSDFEFLPSEPVAVSSADALDVSAIGPGERNTKLYRLGRSLRAKRLPAAAIAEALRAANATCRPAPLDGRELDALIRQVTTQPDRDDFGPASVAPAPARTDPASAARGDAVVVRLADVQPEEVQWVWPGCLARRKFTMLAGDPGLGKTYITDELIARVTAGRAMPDGFPSTLTGDVVVLAAEDGIADTMRPRLDGCGADVTRVHLLTAIRVGEGERGVSLDTDIPRLERVIAQVNAVMVVVDPVSSYLGPVKSGDDMEVRRVLTPLTALAERTDIVLLGLMHLNKNTKAAALHRGMASMAFVAVPRIVLVVGADPDDANPDAPGAQRVLASLKQNICAPMTPLAYAILPEGPCGRFEWRGPRGGVTIEALMSGNHVGAPGDHDEHAGKADQFVAQYLSDGREHHSHALMNAGHQARINRRCLYDSRRRLCDKRREGFGPGAVWYVRLKPEYRAEAASSPIYPTAEIYGETAPLTPSESTTSSLISARGNNGGPENNGDGPLAVEPEVYEL